MEFRIPEPSPKKSEILLARPSAVATSKNPSPSRSREGDRVGLFVSRIEGIEDRGGEVSATVVEEDLQTEVLPGIAPEIKVTVVGDHQTEIPVAVPTIDENGDRYGDFGREGRLAARDGDVFVTVSVKITQVAALGSWPAP